MPGRGRGLLVLALLGACEFPRPADVKNQAVSIGGTVHGMWTGAEGVALRLTADGVDTLYSVPSNGQFSFPTILPEGTSYAVEIVSNPTKHTCALAFGANGIVPADNVTSIEVACNGPAVSISVSAPAPWTFDPTQDAQQPLAASLLLQELTITINSSDGLLRSAQIAGDEVALNIPSSPLSLVPGVTIIDIELLAQGGLSKTYRIPVERGPGAIEQSSYVKASDTGMNKEFGGGVALDRDTLAVGATGDGAQMGGVYVFRRRGSTWEQEAYLKASNAESGDRFGAAVALSGDTLAVGADREDSGAVGINGNQADNSAPDAGAVYVFRRSGSEWVQQAYLKSSHAAYGNAFGLSVTLSEDTLAVGAGNERSVYVFQRSGSTWAKQAELVPPVDESDIPSFGHSVALAGDTLVVGDPFQLSSSGVVHVFEREGGSWPQRAYIREPIAGGAGGNDLFGYRVAVSGDTLIIGAPGEDSASTGIGGNQDDDRAENAGAVYVFERSGSGWNQQAYIKASNAEAVDYFGYSVAVFGDFVGVGALYESSAASGIFGDQTNNRSYRSGAAYVFRRDGGSWSQYAYVKASNTGIGDFFGEDVAVSGDTIAVGAKFEASNATGINGNQASNSTFNAGAVYVFR